MSLTDAYNFRFIDERVSTSGIPTPEQLSSLQQQGYEAVVNLLPDDSDYAIAGERGLVEAQGLFYQHIPVDFSAPNTDDYAAFVAALNTVGERKVLIHCAANYRVSAFYAMYGHQQLGWPVERARALIDDVWNPREHAPWEDFIARVLPDSAS